MKTEIETIELPPGSGPEIVTEDTPICSSKGIRCSFQAAGGCLAGMCLIDDETIEQKIVNSQ